MSTKVLNKSNPIHGGGYHRYAQDKSRIRLMFICCKARFYSCKGLFLKRVFSKQFFNWPYIEWGWSYTKDPSFNATGLPIRSSSRHNCRTPSQNNSRHENIPPKSLVVWPNRNPLNTVSTAIWIGFTLCRGVQLYSQVGYHSTITLVSVQILSKPLPTLARPG